MKNLNKTNWEFLSIARFILALIVMFGHLSEYLDICFFKIVGDSAFEAVFGFLLISGFSIGKSIKTIIITT